MAALKLWTWHKARKACADSTHCVLTLRLRHYLGPYRKFNHGAKVRKLGFTRRGDTPGSRAACGRLNIFDFTCGFPSHS